MLRVRPLARLSVLVTAMALAGCPSLSPQADLPPSVDRVQALEHSGDAAGAARVLEQLAAQNSGSDRNTYELPLYFRKDVWLVKPALQNFLGGPTPYGAGWNMGDWWLSA